MDNFLWQYRLQDKVIRRNKSCMDDYRRRFYIVIDRSYSRNYMSIYPCRWSWSRFGFIRFLVWRAGCFIRCLFLFNESLCHSTFGFTCPINRWILSKYCKTMGERRIPLWTEQKIVHILGFRFQCLDQRHLIRCSLARKTKINTIQDLILVAW